MPEKTNLNIDSKSLWYIHRITSDPDGYLATTFPIFRIAANHGSSFQDPFVNLNNRLTQSLVVNDIQETRARDRINFLDFAMRFEEEIQNNKTEEAIDRLTKIAEHCRDLYCCLLYTSPSPRDATLSRMPSSA